MTCFRKLSSLLIGVCLISSAKAQTLSSYEDLALLFSRTQFGGSARIQGLGGAQVSLGGDYSSALSNPAGLGMFNRSEITLTPGLNFYDLNAEYNGQTVNNSKNRFNIPGISVVLHRPQEDRGFYGGAIGISVTRTNDLNFDLSYSGRSGFSIVDYFLEQADGFTVNELSPDFPVGQAWYNFLITDSSELDISFPQDRYFSEAIPDSAGTFTLQRSENAKRQGSQNQISLSYGGNFQDKLFFGGSLGITFLTMQSTRTYYERDFVFSNTNHESLDAITHEEVYDLEGSGINFTLGLIYRPVDIIQIGASLVTPTLYQLSGNYTSSVQSRWINPGGSYESSTFDPIVEEYTLKTPLRFATGLTVFLSKYGFITGDVEWQNYGRAKYESEIEPGLYNNNNQNIKALYKNTMNYRVGAELRYNVFRIRGGYNAMQNPFQAETQLSDKRVSWSAGLGVKTKKIAVDFAWIIEEQKSIYTSFIFNDNSAPIVNLNQRIVRTMLTIGYTL
jgi:hypothetical protein